MIYLDASALVTLSGRIRTLGAVHIASAQILGDELAALVTYDRRMLEVARSVGLRTEAPGVT